MDNWREAVGDGSVKHDEEKMMAITEVLITRLDCDTWSKSQNKTGPTAQSVGVFLFVVVVGCPDNSSATNFVNRRFQQ